ncbi:MAG: hypothetical protein Unbinned767contig1000_4 [Prokaryotic dsDNA virus sp.]|nr:MAG: hypothetical protein Unbinned767contig1000_4 [Prokaryotic dsDNA virus sp.]|tara:strand:+ start:1037 stop:1339 length:303 start_codon:yes stop_codon:yes gene_type:complete
MKIEATVAEKGEAVTMNISMDREAALVLAAVTGAVLGNPEGPRGVTSVVYSQITNAMQWHSGEGRAALERSDDVAARFAIRLVDTREDMLRELDSRNLSL